MEVQISQSHQAALEKAITLLYGKQLCIDPVIGLGYLSRFAQAIESGDKAFSKNNKIEYIPQSGERIVTTGNLVTMKDSRVDSLQKGTIIKLYLNDYMAVDGDLCSMGVQELADNLLYYRDNPNVSGAIIEVNSGGGEAMAGQIMFNAIRDFKKPVVAYVHNAGSAAFMAIAGVKEIVASGPLSKLGSIGSYISFDKKFIEFYKSRFEDIYSDLSDDKNSAIRNYIETGDKSGIKSMLNESVEAFQKLVTDNRDIKKKDTTLRGGMFSANEAKARGLADIVGTEVLAIKRLKNYF